MFLKLQKFYLTSVSLNCSVHRKIKFLKDTFKVISSYYDNDIKKKVC